MGNLVVRPHLRSSTDTFYGALESGVSVQDLVNKFNFELSQATRIRVFIGGYEIAQICGQELILKNMPMY